VINSKNEIRIHGDVAYIKLGGRGGFYVATVSADKVALVAPYRWYVQIHPKRKTLYGMAVIPGPKKSRKYVLLHRLVCGIKDPGIQIDHESGNGIDCLDSNLRIATNQQNNQNKGLLRTNTSGFIGVSVHKRLRKKFRALLTVKDRMHHGGFHDTAIEAAKARDVLALRLQDPRFVRLNFPALRDADPEYIAAASRAAMAEGIAA